MRFTAFAGRQKQRQDWPVQTKLDSTLARGRCASSFSVPREGPSNVVTKISPALVLVLCLLGGAPGTATGADLKDVLAEYTVTSWTQKDGLPPSGIWSIAQDKDRYLWIGTDAGLFRFDGVRFVAWAPLGSIAWPHASVRAVHVSHDGSLWVGYGESGGISRIHGEQARSFGEREGLSPGTILFISEDGQGLTLAGNAQGLFGFVGERWEKLSGHKGLPEGAVYEAYADHHGNLFVGTATGIFRRAAGSDHFASVASELDGIPRSITEDSSGRLYVTDAIRGVREVGGRESTAATSQRGRGRRLLHDQRGNLWVGTLGQGLWRIGAQRQGQEPALERVTALTGLPSDGVISLLEDHEGNLWVGTSEGLSRLVPRKIIQITTIGLVTGVETSGDGSVWVGTVDELLRFKESALETPVKRVPLGPARLRTMHARHDTLWAATNEYVSSLSGSGPPLPLRSKEPLKHVDLMTTDRRGDLWLYDGQDRVLKWTGARLESVALPAAVHNDRLVEILGDDSGRLWMAFTSTRIGYFTSDGAFQLFGPNDGFTAGACQAIYEDDDGVIWIAGAAGLSRFSRGRFDTLTRGNGFPLDNLTAVVDDEARNLWIGTSTGIMRIGRGEFDKALLDRQYKLQYTLYDRSDGIAGTPLASYSTARPATRAGDGRLWFVTGGGVTVIDPHAMTAPMSLPPVRIEQIVADEVRMAASSPTTLPPRTSRVQIDYTVVNLTSPFKTNFHYRLEGFDAASIDAGTRRQAFYTNLPPRHYRFFLVASNNEGTPLSSTVWDFSIQPMFYQTGWFYLATGSAVILTLWGAWHLRLRRVRREFSMVLGERARLSREIHDTLLQRFVGVALQLEAVAGDTGLSSPTTGAQLVRMRKRVEEYIREARQSIWNLRSPSLECQDVAGALRDFGEQATASGPARFELTVAGTPHPRFGKIEDQLLRIGQEAITNAVRHARATLIKLEIQHGDGTLVLRVSDDGIGFDVAQTSEYPEHHYGLISMKERAAEAGGTLTVASSAATGTQITVIVPTPRQRIELSRAAV